MSEPLSREERLCAMFDSYCKSVLDNTSKHLLRQMMKQAEREGVADSDAFTDTLSQEDEYPSDSFVIYAEELSCSVSSSTLYAAFLSMPLQQRKVLILDFWEMWKDKEIADYIGVSVRTVYNLRQRAYRTVKAFYEKQK